MTLFGTILGIVLGSVVAWALVESLADMGFRKLAFPMVHLGAFVLVAGVAGILAATVPARRAAKVDVLRAVAVE